MNYGFFLNALGCNAQNIPKVSNIKNKQIMSVVGNSKRIGRPATGLATTESTTGRDLKPREVALIS